MEEQKLEKYLSIPELDLIMYENETTITYMSFPIHQVHTDDPMILRVYTSAPYPCIEDNVLERTVCHSGCRSI